MKKSPFRPESALLPFSFIVIALTGQSKTAEILFLALTALQILSLNAPGSFRNAAASEPGVRRVDARFFGALVQSASGIALLFIIKLLNILPFEMPIGIYAASSFLLIERVFEERLYAVSRREDAFMLMFVTFILLTAGTLTGYPAAGGAASLLIALIVTFVNHPIKHKKILFNWNYVLRSLVRDLPCPLLLYLGIKFLSILPVYAFIGWAINTSCGTFARCSPDETRKPLFCVCLSVFIASILSYLIPGISLVPSISAAAVITVLTVFTFNFQSIASAILCTAVCVLSFLGYHIFPIVFSAIMLIIVFDKRIFLRKV